MQLTRESEYALHGLAVLALAPPGEVTALSRIAETEGLPASFLAKIFQKLARHGLLVAARGPGSGYALARPAESITLREILECVEGPRLFEHCLLWSGHRDDNPCPLHEHMASILTALTARLDAVTLAQYASLESRGSPLHQQGLPR